MPLLPPDLLAQAQALYRADDDAPLPDFPLTLTISEGAGFVFALYTLDEFEFCGETPGDPPTVEADLTRNVEPVSLHATPLSALRYALRNVREMLGAQADDPDTAVQAVQLSGGETLVFALPGPDVRMVPPDSGTHLLEWVTNDLMVLIRPEVLR